MPDSRPPQPWYRLPRAGWVFCGLLFLVPLLLWGLTHLQLSGRVENPVSRDHVQAQTYTWFREQFPGRDPVLVSWDKSALDDPRIPAFLDSILGPLDEDGRRAGGIPGIARVQTPHVVVDRLVASAGISREEAISRLQGVLVGSGPLRVKLTRDAHPFRTEVMAALQSKAGQDLNLDLELLPALPEPAAQFATDAPAEELAAETETPIVPEEWSQWKPHDFAVAWPGARPSAVETPKLQTLLRDLRIPEVPGPLAETSFFLPGTPVALAIELTESGEAERGLTLKNLRTAAAQAGIAPTALHITGAEAIGAAFDRAIPAVLWNSSAPWYMPQRSLLILSFVAGAILACSLLGNVRLAGMVLAIVYFATLAAVALVPLLGNLAPWEAITGSNGEFHLMLVLMPPLVLAVTLACAIDVAGEWQRAALRDPASAAAATFRSALRPGMWSAGTTALCLAALMISPLQTIRDFGLYSALGVALALSITLIGLPACLRLFPPKIPTREDIDTRFWQGVGRFIVNYRYGVILLLIAGNITAIRGLKDLRPETKSLRAFAPDTAIVKDAVWMEERVAGTAPVEILVRFDAGAQQEMSLVERSAKIREIQQALRNMPEISGTISLADFLGTVKDPGIDAPMLKRKAYLTGVRKIEEQAATLPLAASFRKTLADATEQNAAGDEVWRIQANLSLTSDIPYATILPKIDRACRMALRTVAGTSDGSFRAPDTAVLYHPGASHLVTGSAPLMLATNEDMLKSLMQTGWLAGGLIALALMVQLRNVPAGLMAMFPNVAPVAVVFGIMSWLGIPVGITGVVTASVALGLSIDGTVHLLSEYCAARLDRRTRPEAVILAVERCVPAMWETSVVLGLGMFVLVPCDLLVISRFGTFMSALIGAALIANTLLTPALLSGPLGWLLDWGMSDKLAALMPLPEPTVETDSMCGPIRIDEIRTPTGPHSPAGTPPRIVRLGSQGDRGA